MRINWSGHLKKGHGQPFYCANSPIYFTASPLIKYCEDYCSIFTWKIQFSSWIFIFYNSILKFILLTFWSQKAWKVTWIGKRKRNVSANHIPSKKKKKFNLYTNKISQQEKFDALVWLFNHATKSWLKLQNLFRFGLILKFYID
jgi:hypothetical protein